MSLYLVAGQGAASTTPITSSDHLPTARPRWYPSDTSEVEWEVLAPYIPVGGTVAGRGGRSVTYSRRDIVDAIRYHGHNGGVWWALPAGFPPWRRVYHYVRQWNRDGTLSRMHNGLREQVRLTAGRAAEPSAAIVDSQSVRGAQTVAKTRRGFDGGKKMNGTKRHIAVDTCELLLVVLVTAASVQDRDGARYPLTASAIYFRRIRMVRVDGAYSGGPVTLDARLGIVVEVVARPTGQVGFKVLPRRWVVERSPSWINRCRHTVHDYERLPEHHAAMVRWAMVIIMTRRLARHRTSTPAPSITMKTA